MMTSKHVLLTVQLVSLIPRSTQCLHLLFVFTIVYESGRTSEGQGRLKSITDHVRWIGPIGSGSFAGSSTSVHYKNNEE